MKFNGVLAKKKGVTFAIVKVTQNAVTSRLSINSWQKSFSNSFPNTPIILTCKNDNGVSKFYGRQDIVDSLSNVSLKDLPWKVYTI